ncbi:Rubredoxin 4 [Hibiscus syriacus]|uniref:Rubredoxin 4 n=1 Tax=Hibiscus syriacus TaxID=106335 RepID=A0A6A3CZV3_HIBSY|nr:rubredoxin-like [Hibiscus syriacus]KAE8734686.1 Rubredoxin 4 [Hibiscus syriacus]
MASATTRLSFSFHHLTQPNPKPKNPHLFHLSHKLPKTNIKPQRNQHPHHFIIHSIDVSKEDSQETPASNSENQSQEPSGEEEKFDKRRLEEKFAVLNTGIYECRSCGFKYDEAVGDPSYPIPPGYQFDKLPDDWRCPTCGAAKSFFQSKSVEIAGFAQNQQYGLGGNTLTSGQKALLIYGTLFFFFVLFLSGYFLQ